MKGRDVPLHRALAPDKGGTAGLASNRWLPVGPAGLASVLKGARLASLWKGLPELVL